jgi:aerobic-type carbon monoxide dehydrogenase small subunit (CoxS/CutS family)
MSSMDEHICRCTGYVRYYEAIKDVVTRRRAW